MQRTALALALVLGLSTSKATESPLPTGTNCALASGSPPNEAGELFDPFEGQISYLKRVFPRLSDLPPTYTGCQVMWTMRLPEIGKPSVSVVYYEDGRATCVWPESFPPICRAGTRESQGCMLAARAVIISFPVGCLARTLDNGKVPNDCFQSFNIEYDQKELVFLPRAQREDSP
jgi:hypothetical protein